MAGRYPTRRTRTKKNTEKFQDKIGGPRLGKLARAQKNSAPEWQPQPKDRRRLSDLLKSWYEARGQELRSGNDTHEPLTAAIQAMGDPAATEFTASTFTTYRVQRIEAGVSPATMNREHAYLRAVFNELRRLDLWKRENPLAKMRQIAVQETELTYLTDEQIFSMLNSLRNATNPHVHLVAPICLSIGARWSEAENLRMPQVRHARITLARTKNDKTRSVPIEPALQEEIEHHAKQQPEQANGGIFGPCHSAFRNGIKRAGNILTLQRILGHSDLKTTMRYAHLAPEHLESARTLNPLNYGKAAA